MLPIKLRNPLHIVDASAGPVTTNGGVTCDFISMKNVIRAYILAQFTQAAGHATGIDPTQSTVVAGGDAKPLVTAVPIWANEDTAAGDTWVAKAAAVTYNVTDDIKKKMVLFQIDPEYFDHAGGFDVLGCTVDDSSGGANLVSISYILEMRYPSTSVLTD